MTNSPAIAIECLSKTFGSTRALDGVSLQVAQGEIVALIGASGSGKSTLLRHISGLVASDKNAGAIHVIGQTVQNGGRIASQVRRIRREVGVVFQQFNLVGRLTVLTNVLAGRLGAMPAWRGLLGLFTAEERRDALRALARVGIAERAHQRASSLSGGQQQRAAIARALVQRAKVILADEPIASLDPESARRVMETLAQINREDGITVLVSLHQVGFALRYCRRVVALDRGRVVYDGAAAQLSVERLRAIYGSDSELDFSDAEAVLDRPAARAPLLAPALTPSYAGAIG